MTEMRREHPVGGQVSNPPQYVARTSKGAAYTSCMVESIVCTSLVRLAHPDGGLWIRGRRLFAREANQSLP